MLTIGGFFSCGAWTWSIFLLWKTGLLRTPTLVLRLCICRFTQLANCWSLNCSCRAMILVPSSFIALGASIFSILCRNLLGATASKYGELDDRNKNLNFLLWICVKKALLHGELFSEICFKCSNKFTFWWYLGKFKCCLIDQDGRWNLYKIEHFQQASTERKKLALISYSHSL